MARQEQKRNIVHSGTEFHPVVSKHQQMQSKFQQETKANFGNGGPCKHMQTNLSIFSSEHKHRKYIPGTKFQQNLAKKTNISAIVRKSTAEAQRDDSRAQETCTARHNKFQPGNIRQNRREIRGREGGEWRRKRRWQETYHVPHCIH